jgi:hypothetical protein
LQIKKIININKIRQNKSKLVIKLLALIFLSISSTLLAKGEIYIRVTQIGFLPEDLKTAVILSSHKLDGKTFHLIDLASNKKVYNGIIGNNKGIFGNFKYSYTIDFTKFRGIGTFKIAIENSRSYKFKIGKNLFIPVTKELMKFFAVQRCGYTNPSLHKVCHIADATSIIDGNQKLNKHIDVTGGWHDAGDYVKFLNTTAITTYTLLFAYDFDKNRFGFDYNNNNVADILEEAKVGLDWLLRLQTDDDRLITQVQNLQDHTVGWRLPENDTLRFNRPAYVGIGKNLIGIYSAALALGSRIWESDVCYSEFAERCIAAAEKYYALKDDVPDVDSSGSGQYWDNNYEGKLALGAVELYETTKKTFYLKDAINFGKAAGAEYWWSYGNISSFAHYKLAKYDKTFISLIGKSLLQFKENKKDKLFDEPVVLGWGSNVTRIGTAIQAILYEKLSHSEKFDSLKINTRDFLLGKNQWGISFITNIGIKYSKHFHHQISFIKHITLPGGFAAGPVEKNFLNSYKIKFDKKDRYKKFQTELSYYRDDRMDYVTNEPTILGNAMALFFFGCFR